MEKTIRAILGTHQHKGRLCCLRHHSPCESDKRLQKLLRPYDTNPPVDVHSVPRYTPLDHHGRQVYQKKTHQRLLLWEVKLPLKSGVLSFVQNVDKELKNGCKAGSCGIHAGI